MTRHIILTLGRSGSNALSNLLNQHPNILNVGEVLGDWNQARKLRNRLNLYPDNTAGYLDALTRRSLYMRSMIAVRNLNRLVSGKAREIKPISRIQSFGFKDFVTLLDQENGVAWLQQSEDIKVIGLVRDDVLARMISWQMLDQTGVVKSTGTHHAGQKQLHFEPEKFLEHLRTVDQETKLLVSVLKSLPSERVLSINYDDLFGSQEGMAKTIMAAYKFLGMPPFYPELKFKKIITVPPAQLIANRQECAKALVGTEFAYLIPKLEAA